MGHDGSTSVTVTMGRACPEEMGVYQVLGRIWAPAGSKSARQQWMERVVFSEDHSTNWLAIVIIVDYSAPTHIFDPKIISIIHHHYPHLLQAEVVAWMLPTIYLWAASLWMLASMCKACGIPGTCWTDQVS